MILRVAWLEWFKLRKRLASWGLYLTFLALSIFLYGTPYYSAHGHGGGFYRLPQSWPLILTQGAPIASIFGAVLVALTVSSEFDWRTSRQNIIDGLSRNAWFIGKLLLLPAVVVGLYGTQVVLGTGLALLDTTPARMTVHLPLLTYLGAAFGVALGIYGYAAVALLVSMRLRSTGPAIAVTIIVQVFDSIVARTLRGFHHDAIAAWLPFQVQGSLFQFGQYLPTPATSLEVHWATATLLLAGIGWAAGLSLGAYAFYIRRDL